MRVIGCGEFVTSILMWFIVLLITHVVEPGVIGSRSNRKQSLPSQDDLSQQQAMKFLKDYGYIEIQPSNSTSHEDGKQLSQEPSMPPSTQSTDEGQSKTVDTDWKDGIKAFQRRYHLPITGEIDEATKEIMAKPRCGVPDYQLQIKQSIDSKNQELSELKGDSRQSTMKEKPEAVTPPVMITERAVTNTAQDGKQLGKAFSDPLSEISKSGKGVNKFPFRPPNLPVAPVEKPSPDNGGWDQFSIVEVSSMDDFEDFEDSAVDNQDIKEVSTTPTPEEEINGTTVLTYTVTEVVTTLVSELDAKEKASTPSYPTSDGKDKNDKSGLRPKRDIREVVRQVMSGSHRHRRDSDAAGQSSSSSGASGVRYSNTITWRVLDAYPSQYIPDTSSIFTAAFRRWAEVTPLIFREQNSGDVLNVDILIAFASSNDLSDFGDSDFADHRWSPGQLALSDVSNRHIFFNNGILWTDRSDQDYNLQSVAAHEIGHFLGLGHSTNISSIMYPIYRSFNGKVTIDDNTKTAVQNIYGTCNNSLDTVFDWMRLSSNNGWTYTTYFARSSWSWVYVNSRSEVKYGEPKQLSNRFNGVPDDLDAVVQNVDKPRDEMYFFKGNKYWRFNHASRSVYTTTVDGVNWSANGRLISEGWPAKSGSNTRIPDNIDAAYYDRRDNNYYFFKRDKVYAYDMEEGGCCLENYPMSISSAYPGEFSYISPLPDDLDAAYYSIKHKKLFFFKGAYYWEHATFDPSANTIYNRVKERASWDRRWRDICDVE